MNEIDVVIIFGVCFFENGYVVLFDKFNGVVKVYDDMNVLVMFRKFSYKFYDVIQVFFGDIVVVLLKEYSVNILLLCDLFMVFNGWINNYKGKCFGLMLIDINIFVIWKENDVKEYIFVYSSNYIEIRKINVFVECFLVVNLVI